MDGGFAIKDGVARRLRAYAAMPAGPGRSEGWASIQRGMAAPQMASQPLSKGSIDRQQAARPVAAPIGVRRSSWFLAAILGLASVVAALAAWRYLAGRPQAPDPDAIGVRRPTSRRIGSIASRTESPASGRAQRLRGVQAVDSPLNGRALGRCQTIPRRVAGR